MNKVRFEALDAFRGLCALCVVIHHLRVSGTFTELSFFRNSSIFVEFFFVLSGFVLAHGYGFKEKIEFKPFVTARFFRIYPLHFFMFCVIFIIEIGKWAAYKYGGLVFNSEPFTGHTAIREIIPNLLLIQSWTSLTTWSFNAPSWSISIEFYLYIILFFTVSIFHRFKVLAWLLTSSVMFALLFAGNEYLVSAVVSGLSCFFGGAFIYYIYTKTSNIKISYLAGSMIEVILIIAILFIVSSNFQNQKALGSLLFVVVVWFFSFESGVISRILVTQPLQVLGKLSYSIYMTHTSIIFIAISTLMVIQKATNIDLASTIDGIRFLSLGSDLYNYILLFSMLCLTIFISNITFKYVELKGQKVGRRINKRRARNSY
jgi:peptidoglycan/LPS O-acetylase OafA/YrhL